MYDWQSFSSILRLEVGGSVGPVGRVDVSFGVILIVRNVGLRVLLAKRLFVINRTVVTVHTPKDVCDTSKQDGATYATDDTSDDLLVLVGQTRRAAVAASILLNRRCSGDSGEASGG